MSKKLDFLVEFIEFMENKILMGVPREEVDEYGDLVSGGYGPLTKEERVEFAREFLDRNKFPQPQKTPVKLRVRAIRGHADPEDMETEETRTFASKRLADAFIRGIEFAHDANFIEWQNAGTTYPEWDGGNTRE